MSFDLQRILESKAAHRRQLADLPIGEKLTLLDALRERAIAIRNATPTPDSSVFREDPAPCRTGSTRPVAVLPPTDPHFIGAEAAFQRASAKAIAKAIAKACAAGLEPIVSNPADLPKKP
jgi:hypothetical protein